LFLTLYQTILDRDPTHHPIPTPSVGEGAPSTVFRVLFEFLGFEKNF